MNTQNNVDYSLMYYAEWKKPDVKAYTLHNSIYMKSEEISLIYTDISGSEWFPGTGVGKRRVGKRSSRVTRTIGMLGIFYNLGYIITHQNSSNYALKVGE